MLSISDRPILNAVKATLDAIVGPAPRTRRATRQQPTKLEMLWQDMTTAGNHLQDALRIEHESTRLLDSTQRESEDYFEQWKAQRIYVERTAAKYALAVSNWRE